VGLLSSMTIIAGALDAYERVLEVTANNVANASTPGYAAQVQTLEAMPSDPSSGRAGGVEAGQIQSERNQYADQQVQQQTTLLGQAQQQVNSLTSVQNLFDVTGTSGISVALSNLFDSFSNWAQSPNDAVAQQNVLDNASDVAAAFQQTATGLTQAEQDAETGITESVNTVNTLVGQLQTFNTKIMQGDTGDAGLDAEVHSTLEQLSQYVSFTTLNNADGTISVLMNGQTPLLIENQQFQISAAAEQPASPAPTYPNGRPPMEILASDGTDITADTTGGQLGALVNFRDSVLPSFIGDGYQQGQLNQMAQQFADQVNQLVEAGQTAAGGTATPLFTYDTSDPNEAASSLAVNPDITTSDLAAGDGTTSNGTALALSGLENPTASADEINGESFTQFYGNMAAQVGNLLDTANANLTIQQSAVAQAKNIQQQMSGVSLDQEATVMIQFQEAYDANARMLTVLDQLAEDTINMLPTS
jgi:flagellar hook-associated protein 1